MTESKVDDNECAAAWLCQAPDDGIRTSVVAKALADMCERNGWEVWPLYLRRENDDSAAVAAIQFALHGEEGMAFLRCWNEGNFDACREEWPEAPDECYIGADPLFASLAACTPAKSEGR